MRETYQLSDETRRVLSGNVIAVAEEMGKSPQYLYAVMAGTETDVFAKFKPFYAASVRAGAEVGHWKDWMAAVDQRNAAARPALSPVDALIEKIRSDGETSTALAAALKDGRIDAREATTLMILVSRERQVLDQIERLVLGKKEI